MFATPLENPAFGGEKDSEVVIKVPLLRMLGIGLLLKTTALLVSFLWLVKSLKNL